MNNLSGSEKRRVPDYRNPKEVVHGTIVIDNATCTGCALCTYCCAGRAIKIVNKKAVFYEEFKEAICVYCADCEAICPVGAITMGAPYEMTGMYKTIDKGKPQPPRL